MQYSWEPSEVVDEKEEAPVDEYPSQGLKVRRYLAGTRFAMPNALLWIMSECGIINLLAAPYESAHNVEPLVWFPAQLLEVRQEDLLNFQRARESWYGAAIRLDPPPSRLKVQPDCLTVLLFSACMGRIVAHSKCNSWTSDFYFRYLYFLMFALFNAIYWTHVKMAADSSREELPKNFGPDLSE